MIEAERILLNHALEDPVNQPLLLFLMVRFKKFIQETLFSTMPGRREDYLAQHRDVIDYGEAFVMRGLINVKDMLNSLSSLFTHRFRD
ncbi:uncharacterized protein LOC133710584 isoform X2 [Rosa rugosa]|uniref:uncharacterized protein LOC133710584 isoform X2 n=1 Tax=Rosa rugosa TaxID=74645 RepID=UPI002B417D4D|nr:uncharacterized protein LOC133710584 isoform X2 [Rosa rugosa]